MIQFPSFLLQGLVSTVSDRLRGDTEGHFYTAKKKNKHEVQLLRNLSTVAGFGNALRTHVPHEVQMRYGQQLKVLNLYTIFYPANILCLLSSAFLVPFTLQNCLKLQKVRNPVLLTLFHVYMLLAPVVYYWLHILWSCIQG